jgi:nucleotide-binding universal stress UspA family protein
MILICYDGSDDAKAAIERGGELLGGQPATVLTVWEPFLQMTARTPVGFGVVPPIPDTEAIDQAGGHRASTVADEGTELADRAGFNAQPRSRALEATVARTVLSEAEEVGAGAILMGSRGRTGLKSLLLGSVSHEVIQRADRTVIVVPSPEVAAARSER